MLLQLFLLGIITFFAPLVPPILSPLGFSFTGLLLVEKANPRILSLITVGVGVFSAIIIWVVQNHVIKKLSFYEKIENTNRFHRVVNKINRKFKDQEKLIKISQKREEYIKTRTGRFATFIFAIFCFLPVLPDIIGTRILYKKIKFPYFIIAVIIGKSITHMTFIFVGKSLLELILTRM